MINDTTGFHKHTYYDRLYGVKLSETQQVCFKIFEVDFDIFLKYL